MVRERSLVTAHVVEDAFRYSNYDTPLWARSNTRPGRWHVPGDGPTQYLALTAEGAWAELIRSESLHTEDEVAMVRMPLWVARIDQGAVVDFRDFGAAEAAGLPPDALVDDDHGRCQAAGRRLRDLGYTGILAPSAALPGEHNLTLFGARLAVTWGTAPHLASAIPAKILTVGAPPHALVDRVRLRDAPHAGFAGWRDRTGRRG